MTQNRLHDLLHSVQIRTYALQKSMPQYMTAETREEHRLIVNIVVFFKDFAITIPHDSTQCLIQCSLMLHLSEAVDEDKIRITFDMTDTNDIIFFLILFLHLKCFDNALCHRDFTDTCLGFGCIDRKNSSHAHHDDCNRPAYGSR